MSGGISYLRVWRYASRFEIEPNVYARRNILSSAINQWDSLLNLPPDRRKMHKTGLRMLEKRQNNSLFGARQTQKGQGAFAKVFAFWKNLKYTNKRSYTIKWEKYAVLGQKTGDFAKKLRKNYCCGICRIFSSQIVQSVYIDLVRILPKSCSFADRW